MEYWKKERNYRKQKCADQTLRYIITVDGTDVDVSAEIYQAYAQADRRERYCREREAGLLLSLEQMDEDGMPFTFFMSGRSVSFEDIIMRGMAAKAALDALSLLPHDERHLIEAVVMAGVTESEYAAYMGISQVAVHRRKQRILKKISIQTGY